MYVDVDECKTVNVYSQRLQNSQRLPIQLQALISRCCLTPVFMLVILTARMFTGAMVQTVWMESAWLVGQVFTVLLSFIIQWILPVFILAAGTVY